MLLENAGYIFEEMARLLILHNENLILKCKAMKYANIAQVLLSKYLLVRTT